MRAWVVLVLFLFVGCTGTTAETLPSGTPPPSLSNYDAIDFLPDNINGYLTEGRITTTTETECRTSAMGSYRITGSTDAGVVVVVCGAKDINQGIRELKTKIFGEFITGPSITLNRGIQGNYVYHPKEFSSIIWWTQEDFIFYSWAIPENPNRDTKNMATNVANAVIQNQ